MVEQATNAMVMLPRVHHHQEAREEMSLIITFPPDQTYFKTKVSSSAPC